MATKNAELNNIFSMRSGFRFGWVLHMHIKWAMRRYLLIMIFVYFIKSV